jgi:predicted small metal-binding protein
MTFTINEVVYMESYMQIVCEPTCGFMVKSHDMKELKTMGMSHATNIHKMKVTDKDIEKMMSPA